MQEFIEFIKNSKSAYHAVKEIEKKLKAAGFEEIKENKEWNLNAGKYYVKRNDSTIAAFVIPKGRDIEGFHIVAAHSDSPTFKVKENPEIKDKYYVRINTEKYGGMIMNSWFDRPLSVAGRVAVLENDEIVTKLVDIDKDLMVIPSVAIHMNRDTNNGYKYDAQIDTIPLFGGAADNANLLEKIAVSNGMNKDDILGHDLFLYAREEAKVIGANEEYILSPRLDDLQSTYIAVKAICDKEVTSDNYINMLVVFDNEEVGSGSGCGADSTFLSDVLIRISENFQKNHSWLCTKLANSFMISADNAHAVHPNHPEYADPTNRPYINNGVVIKFHAGQKYTTDAYSAAYMKKLAMDACVPYQIYTNKSNIAGGSTLGNISMSHVSVRSADIGFPQLSMHSAVETAGVKDFEYGIKLFKTFFSSTIK